MGGRREVGPHPPDGCHPRHPRPGVRRLRAPDPPRHRARRRRRSPASPRCRSAAPPSAPASTRPPGSRRRSSRSSPRRRVCRSPRRSTTSRRRAPATGSSRHPVPCASSPCRSPRSATTCAGWAPARTPASASCTSPTCSPDRRSCPARSTRSSPRPCIMVGARVIGNDATIAWAGATGAFELNVAIPVMGTALLESIRLLANSTPPARRQDRRRPRGQPRPRPRAGRVVAVDRDAAQQAHRLRERRRRSPSTRSPRA